MFKEISNEIETSKEVFSNLPTSNQKSVNKYLSEIEFYKNKYEKLRNEICDELNSRSQNYFNTSPDNFLSIDNAIKEASKALVFSNDMITPYEKLKLDKNIYQLAHYMVDDLLENNKRILKIVKKFQSVGILLSNKDFRYTNYVFEYMSAFFKNINNLEHPEIKEAFDKVFWKCPALFTQIELNFRYLYLKNENIFRKYIEEIKKEINRAFSKNNENLIDSYARLRSEKYDAYFNDKNNLLYKFSSMEYKPEDYQEENIKKIKEKLFPLYDSNVANLFKISLEEYKNFLKYRNIVDKIKEINSEELEKNYVKNRIKNISKLEKKLFKLNKKAKISARKTRIDKYELQIGELIKNIKTIYDEIDSNIFKASVKEKIEDNSTIFKGLLLSSFYYEFMALVFKETNPDISYEELDNEIKSLYSFVLNPNNQIINNTAIKSENDLSDVIVEMYKLSNVNVNKSDLDHANIDKLIENVNKIIIKEKLDKFGIDLSVIAEYEEIRRIKEKNK